MMDVFAATPLLLVSALVGVSFVVGWVVGRGIGYHKGYNDGYALADQRAQLNATLRPPHETRPRSAR